MDTIVEPNSGTVERSTPPSFPVEPMDTTVAPNSTMDTIEDPKNTATAAEGPGPQKRLLGENGSASGTDSTMKKKKIEFVRRAFEVCRPQPRKIRYPLGWPGLHSDSSSNDEKDPPLGNPNPYSNPYRTTFQIIYIYIFFLYIIK
jgi:hypothetical protein